MNKKNFFPLLAFILAFSCISVIINSCGDSTSKELQNRDIKKPINLSIFLDLSDRIIRPDVTPSQMYNDTAIVNYLVDFFIKECVNQKIINSKNKFQIFFYPTPNESNITTLAKSLCVDMSKLEPKSKKLALENMRNDIPKALDAIYNNTINDHNFIGCDIWEFFSDKKVDSYCINPDYNNILVILTDGYLFHQDNKIKQGEHAYSYILPQTLSSDSQATLIANRNDLQNISVLMLEINPYDPKHRNPMINILDRWFKDMGLNEGQYLINETDLVSRTTTVIDNFLKQTY